MRVLVLHTTRTAAELGRYESPELTSADVELFLVCAGGESRVQCNRTVVSNR